MKVGLEKLESHEGIAVKALLDSGATGLVMDTAFAKEKGFRMEKMKKPLLVKNMDRSVNIGGAITHQVECNMFFKEYIERVRMDVCNLEKMKVILGMPWLAAHNPEIDWKKGEVKMTKYPPVTNFIRPYLHQFFEDSHGIKASLKPLRRPFDRYQSRLEAINNGQDIRQINW